MEGKGRKDKKMRNASEGKEMKKENEMRNAANEKRDGRRRKEK